MKIEDILKGAPKFQPDSLDAEYLKKRIIEIHEHMIENCESLPTMEPWKRLRYAARTLGKMDAFKELYAELAGDMPDEKTIQRWTLEQRAKKK